MKTVQVSVANGSRRQERGAKGPKKTFLLLILLAIAITACSNTIQTEEVRISPTINGLLPAYMISPTDTVVVQATIEPTPTNYPTPTLEFSPTPENLKVIQNCVTINADEPLPLEYSGQILFSGEGQLTTSYILTIPGGERKELTEDDAFTGSFQISPSRHFAAYIRTKRVDFQASLEVMNHLGDVIHSIPWPDDWRHISGWLDNEWIWISVIQGDNPYETPDRLFLLNPFSGESRDLDFDFPNLENDYPGTYWSWFWSSVTIFDPSLTTVLYPVGVNSLAFMDLQTGNLTSEITGTISIDVTPRWSPDNQVLVLAGPENLSDQPKYSEANISQMELYQLGRDGSLNRLTYLSEIYEEVRLGDYVWSPSGKMLAFSLAVEPENYPVDVSAGDLRNGSLAILDLDTMVVTDYCLPSFIKSKPVWSPDGRFILFYNDVNNIIYRSEVFLFDILNETVVKIAEDTSPVGWLQGSP